MSMTDYQKTQKPEGMDEKEYRKRMLKTDVRRMVLILFCSVVVALNINTFVHTGGLYPGGATGLTVLVQRIGEQYWGIHLPYTLINLIMNAFPVYIGFRYIYIGYSPSENGFRSQN